MAPLHHHFCSDHTCHTQLPLCLSLHVHSCLSWPLHHSTTLCAYILCSGHQGTMPIDYLLDCRQVPALYKIEAGINPQSLLCGILLNCCEGQRKGLVLLLSLDNQYNCLVLSDDIRKDLCQFLIVRGLSATS